MNVLRFGGVDIDYRIVKTKNYVENVISYDLDNAYPQRMIAYAKQSGMTSRCLKVFSKHIMGRGFKDKTFYNAVVNQKGQTADELLRITVDNYKYCRSFAWHIRYNAKFQIVEIKNIPFEQCRFAHPDGFGVCQKVAVFNDWEKKLYKVDDKRTPEYYDRFNPNQEVIARQVELAGGWEKWKGQVLFWTPQSGEYEEATFDSVLNDVITDYELSNYNFTNVTSGFVGTMVYLHPTELSMSRADDEALSPYETKERQLQGMVGPNGARLIILDNIQNNELPLKPIEAPDMDKKFEKTQEVVTESIRQNFLLPPILIGQEMSVGLGNNEIIKNAFEMYNMHTYDERYQLEQVFQKVFGLWHVEANPSKDYTIVPLTWGMQTGVTVDETQVTV